jgi:hypothetical protein
MNYINIAMNYIPPERMVLLATQIAIEIAKGKNTEELNIAKSMASQISSALQVIICQRLINDKCKKDDK